MKPQSMPWVIEKVRGIRIIVKKAGRPSSIFRNSIWLTLLNIDAPTRTSTGAVAYAGTMPAKGARKKHGRKQRAVKTEVKIGLRRQGDVEILDGVKPGDLVVTAGVQKIRNGTLVRAVEGAGG